MRLKSSRIINNASWIIGCKILKSLISFVIGIFTVRYLGPSNYGLVSYAAAIVSFVTPIMQLGLPSILVNEIVKNPDEEGRIVGTSLVLNIISAIASVIGVLSFVLVANAGEKDTIIVCFLYSLILVFQASEMTQYWFQAKLLSKYSSLSSLIAYFIVSLYKVFILITGKSIVWFAITHVIEAIIISVLLFVLYNKQCNQKLSFSFAIGKDMFSRSKYYILSGLMLVLCTQTDKIMLKFMISETETGFYSAAITCIGITSFVFSAIIDSARPLVFEARRHSMELFEKRLSLTFSIIIFLSLAQSVFMTIFSDLIISILYGTSYMPASNVLKIAVWYITFSNIGVVESMWIVAENKQKYLPVVNLLGAILNIFVNILLIPLWGACGAALASISTQLFSKVVLFIVIKPMRPVSRIMLKSFNPFMLIAVVRKKDPK